MNIILIGAAGFIGTNLGLKLIENTENLITLVDEKRDYFCYSTLASAPNVRIKEARFGVDTDFKSLLDGQQVVYHLVSSTVPTTSNQRIVQELNGNVVATAKLLEACVNCGIEKVIFISSGGTVYGKENSCPLKENVETNPINSYGIQKVTIEKLLYLYRYMYGLDYRVIRLANPYGPYQRPNGVLGAVTTFTYKALRNEEITVYGDGSVIRDFIYIDDAIRGILTIAKNENKYRLFNLGCGYGTSINKVLDIIQHVLGQDLKIIYKTGRKVDVPMNFLDISRYENAYGKLNPISITDGIKLTAEFMKKYYGL